MHKSIRYRDEVQGYEGEVRNYQLLGQLDCTPKFSSLVIHTYDLNGEKNIIGSGILLEYFPLKDLAKHYDASITEKLVWMRQILRAVVEMEQINFNYCDMTCRNIVPDQTRRTKIIDIGNHGYALEWSYPAGKPNMVFSLGKTVEELFTRRVPLIGVVTEGVLMMLPEDAAIVARACCNSEKVPTAMEVERLLAEPESNRNGKTLSCEYKLVKSHSYTEAPQIHLVGRVFN